MLVQRRLVVTAALLVAAVIHLLPLVGVLGATRLEALYGLPVTDANLAILMRHRAVLFGLLGAFLAVAAFRPVLQGAAFVAGFVSVLSFLGLAWSTGGYNDLQVKKLGLTLPTRTSSGSPFAWKRVSKPPMSTKSSKSLLRPL